MRRGGEIGEAQRVPRQPFALLEQRAEDGGDERREVGRLVCQQCDRRDVVEEHDLRGVRCGPGEFLDPRGRARY